MASMLNKARIKHPKSIVWQLKNKNYNVSSDNGDCKNLKYYPCTFIGTTIFKNNGGTLFVKQNYDRNSGYKQNTRRICFQMIVVVEL